MLNTDLTSSIRFAQNVEVATNGSGNVGYGSLGYTREKIVSISVVSATNGGFVWATYGDTYVKFVRLGQTSTTADVISFVASEDVVVNIAYIP